MSISSQLIDENGFSYMPTKLNPNRCLIYLQTIRLDEKYDWYRCPIKKCTFISLSLRSALEHGRYAHNLSFSKKNKDHHIKQLERREERKRKHNELIKKTSRRRKSSDHVNNFSCHDDVTLENEGDHVKLKETTEAQGKICNF